MYLNKLLFNERLTGSLLLIVFLVITLWSGYELVWMFGGLPLALLAMVLGITIIVMRAKKHRKKSEVIRHHFLIILLSFIAIVSPLWSYAISTTHFGINSKVNTLKEFAVHAENCAITGIQIYKNDIVHRVNDATAYIETSIDQTSDNLYFSVTQKDTLKKIIIDNSAACPDYKKLNADSSEQSDRSWNLQTTTDRVF